MVLVFFSSYNFYNTSNEFLNYQLRSIYHADMNHLIANGISFFILSFMEGIIGWKRFLSAIVFIWFVSAALLYFYHKIFPSRKVYTVGFSAVIFGLFVVYFTVLNQSPMVSTIGLIASILPQIFVPGISYEGHIMGVIAGIMYVLLFPIPHELRVKK